MRVEEFCGHTSDEGKRDFNMKLSRKRAEAVELCSWCRRASTRSESARSATDPTNRSPSNQTKDGKEKNRRIEFRLLGTQESVKTQAEPEASTRRPSATARVRARRRRRARTQAQPLALRRGGPQTEEGKEGGRFAARRRSDALRQARQGQGRPRRQGEGRQARRPKGELSSRKAGPHPDPLPQAGGGGGFWALSRPLSRLRERVRVRGTARHFASDGNTGQPRG